MRNSFMKKVLFCLLCSFTPFIMAMQTEDQPEGRGRGVGEFTRGRNGRVMLASRGSGKTKQSESSVGTAGAHQNDTATRGGCGSTGYEYRVGRTFVRAGNTPS